MRKGGEKIGKLLAVDVCLVEKSFFAVVMEKRKKKYQQDPERQMRHIFHVN